METPLSEMQSLVLVRPDRVGDVIVTSSCLGPLRAARPGLKIHFMAQARMAPLFHRHPALQSFIALPDGPGGEARVQEIAARLRQVRPDGIAQLLPDGEIECAAARAEVPRRLGFAHAGGKWLTEAVGSPEKRGEKHEGLYNFDLLGLLGVAAPEKLKPWLTPDETAVARLAKKLPDGITAGKYAVLHIGSHVGKPLITADFFCAAARWLAGVRGLRVVLIGAEPGDAIIREIITYAGGAKDAVYDFCGQTDLAEAAFLLRDAAVVFGRDSGPAHLAAAMGARTVTLMLEPEPENSAQRWKPLGERSWALEKPLERKWHESRARFAARNLAQYTPGEILDALRLALEA